MPDLRAVAALALLLGTLAVACGGGHGKASTTPAEAASGRAETFAQAETRLLGALAVSGPALARRLAVAPAGEARDRVGMGALVAGDETTALAGGGLAVLAFDARARLLDETERAARALPARGEAEELERRLLVRLARDEGVRVTRERGGARGAVLCLEELSRSLAAEGGDDGTSDGTRDEARDEVGARARDDDATRTIQGLRRDLASAPLTPLERDAVDDALDPLERSSEGAARPGAQPLLAAVAALRVDLAARAVVAPPSPAKTSGFVASLPGATGVTDDADGYARRLATSRAILGRWLDGALPRLGDGERRRVLARGGTIVEERVPCAPKVPSSPVRSAGPPPERAGFASVLCALARPAKGGGDADVVEDAPALVAAHDRLTVALWALDVHGRGVAPSAAQAAHALRSTGDASTASRYLRRVVVDPEAAMASGIGVALLIDASAGGERREEAARDDGPAAWRRRAAAWLAFGDAPLDARPDARPDATPTEPRPPR